MFILAGYDGFSLGIYLVHPRYIFDMCIFVISSISFTYLWCVLDYLYVLNVRGMIWYIHDISLVYPWYFPGVSWIIFMFYSCGVWWSLSGSADPSWAVDGCHDDTSYFSTLQQLVNISPPHKNKNIFTKNNTFSQGIIFSLTQTIKQHKNIITKNNEAISPKQRENLFTTDETTHHICHLFFSDKILGLICS